MLSRLYYIMGLQDFHSTYIVNNPPSETTVYFQSVKYNDAISSNQRNIKMKSEHVKQSGELRGKEREREREQQISEVRDGALDRSGVGVGKKWPLENLNN
jgi:hypothetical protein